MKEQEFEDMPLQQKNKSSTAAIVDYQKQFGIDKNELIRRAYAGKLPPGVQVDIFRNADQLFPTRIISRGSSSNTLPPSKQQMENFSFYANGNHYDLYDYISRNRVAGLMVLKDNKLVLEHYELGNNAQTRWMSMSMAKSISTTMVGIAIKQGYINSIDDALTTYLPELQGGTYGDVTIKQLLQMTSGAQWNEDHTNPHSERRDVLELQIGQQPGSILRYMSQLPKVTEPGSHWNYSTGETQVVGSLLYAATGKYLADYLSETLWSKLGMESDAYWWLESPQGLEVAGSGISATLRDYARFGLFIMNNGVHNGEQLLPDNWVKEATSPSNSNSGLIPYGYMWWLVPNTNGKFTDAAFSARGIFGQRIYINQSKNTVIVVWSARSKPMGSENIIDNDFFNAVVDTLASD
ncbi:beta-lactamase family protein [Dasania sp. GY-MA-18]|uniref:Serine hydrolase n=1 Tax=Dasania phycosphaerae TaxID=2950436 RepID=A0A9J6RHY1_9GAMM|nr:MULTISPECIES: serine hydrolase [Dasania]MCR8921858.1 beta-lactamase family protein [Dasania sp. GY-MA-18]MCZ0864286.1 serine hydrolase [Dasania phycosphaerae]MCZ0868014.1 serine hydrolase [Dasania phycosphaerae]